MEFDRWAIPNVVNLIEQARQAVMSGTGLGDDEINVRFMWSEDWDVFNVTAMTSNTYVQNFSAATTNTFKINKVDKAFAVVLIGVLLGNLGNLLASIQIMIGQKTTREYPGTLISSQLNGVMLFMDGIFTLEKKKVEFIFYNAGGAPAACTAYPFGVVIIPAGA